MWNTLVIARASQLIIRQAFRFSDQSNCASHSIALGTSLYLFVFFYFIFTVNPSDPQSSWHSLRSRIESDMQCQPANPRANQLQRDANLSGSQHTATSTHTHSFTYTHTHSDHLDRWRNPRHGKLAPNYFQHSKSSGTTAENSQSDFRNVVCTKDCWQFLIVKDSRKIYRDARQADEMPNWMVER